MSSRKWAVEQPGINGERLTATEQKNKRQLNSIEINMTMMNIKDYQLCQLAHTYAYTITHTKTTVAIYSYCWIKYNQRTIQMKSIQFNVSISWQHINGHLLYNRYETLWAVMVVNDFDFAWFWSECVDSLFFGKWKRFLLFMHSQ